MEESVPKPIAVFYAVRSSGMYYRTYAQGGRRAGWVNDLTDARLWTTIGPAKGKITALSNERPGEPVPELVEFIVREVNVVDQKSRVTAARTKKQLEVENRKKAHAEWELQQAQRDLAAAQAKIDRLKKGQ